MISHGWQRWVLYLTLVSALGGKVAFAGSLTIREIVLKGNNEVEIQFDSAISKKQIEYDFVRDIAQVTIQNATLYPAKIIHADKQVFNKVFAYQYAPNVVRIRFTVDGVAGQFEGRLVTKAQGTKLSVQFPSPPAVKQAVVTPAAVQKAAVQKTDEATEKKLLSKVLKPTQETEEKSVVLTKNLTGKKMVPVAALGGLKPGPSVFRSLFSMLLIVGGLGGVLVWVKRKKGASQATRVGKGWWSQLLPEGMRKQKSFIEVVAQHALGPKQSITVVRIRGQQFVLGVTQDSIQLITQLDADEGEVDLFEDPAVTASLGKMFGGATAGHTAAISSKPSFASLVKSSDVADVAAATPAVVVRTPAVRTPVAQTSGIREQIRRRLEGAQT